MSPIRRRAAAGLALAAIAGRARAQAAQEPWPARPVRIIVPSAPGGGADFTARVFGRFLERRGQPVVVENRPGAGAVIGTDAAKSMPPDGHGFVLATNSTHAANPFLFRKLPYDPLRDFAMVGLFGSYPSILVVDARAPYRDVAGLVAAARARPGGLFFGYYSSSSRVPAELLRAATGAEMAGVSYRNVTQILTDLRGGEVAFAFLDALSAAPALQEGSGLRAIGSSAPARDPRRPEIAAVAETLPGFAMEGWMGLAAPAATPPALLARANAAMAEAIAAPEVRKAFEEQGLAPRSLGLEAARDFLAADTARWREWVRIAGIEPE
ncbi:ABC transporter substrate-binding protein [Pseudoroseomonas deserti]|uniref:ABC transporter substrate-binding protein n=1 Tax=Teichococcus deserti TaxID=1817963 RepID=A0A1V2H4U7_9PROT|nr:tripartite tricarboxylate transporter substrate binding protein [Pseudoroseomonas deserti]ONG56070.1 ABC transporter substrate-binding protein [Pseudoroseomonas deserti]